jgi:hypothetical protein
MIMIIMMLIMMMGWKLLFVLPPKRLGHEQLLHKRSSVKYAEKVAEKKIGDQPEKRENPGLDELRRVGEPMAAGY